MNSSEIHIDPTSENIDKNDMTEAIVSYGESVRLKLDEVNAFPEQSRALEQEARTFLTELTQVDAPEIPIYMFHYNARPVLLEMGIPVSDVGESGGNFLPSIDSVVVFLDDAEYRAVAAKDTPTSVKAKVVHEYGHGYAHREFLASGDGSKKVSVNIERNALIQEVVVEKDETVVIGAAFEELFGYNVHGAYLDVYGNDGIDTDTIHLLEKAKTTFETLAKAADITTQELFTLVAAAKSAPNTHEQKLREVLEANHPNLYDALLTQQINNENYTSVADTFDAMNNIILNS